MKVMYRMRRQRIAGLDAAEAGGAACQVQGPGELWLHHCALPQAEGVLAVCPHSGADTLSAPLAYHTLRGRPFCLIDPQVVQLVQAYSHAHSHRA